MVCKTGNLTKSLFSQLQSYSGYFEANKLDTLLGIDLADYGDIEKKIVKGPYDFKKTYNQQPFPPELDDLCRLHYLTTSRKCTTVLEFGVGKSTFIFSDALQKNSEKYSRTVSSELRRSNAFELHSVDDEMKWINAVKNDCRNNNVNFHFSKVSMSTFNDRTCTFYENLPAICPDLIYIDGPARFSAKGSVNGFTTNFGDGMPMSADVLRIEHFLLPGTLIVVDGRSGNARFLKSNFQREWSYCYDETYDQHFFELTEAPLGIFNRRQIDFCLGDEFYNRLQNNTAV